VTETDQLHISFWGQFEGGVLQDLATAKRRTVLTQSFGVACHFFPFFSLQDLWKTAGIWVSSIIGWVLHVGTRISTVSFWEKHTHSLSLWLTGILQGQI
jgi:hypothetical protein